MKLITQYILIAFVFLVISSKPTYILVDSKKQEVWQKKQFYSAFSNYRLYQFNISKHHKINIRISGIDELSVSPSSGIYNSNDVYVKCFIVDSEGKIEVLRKYNKEFDKLNFNIIPTIT